MFRTKRLFVGYLHTGCLSDSITRKRRVCSHSRLYNDSRQMQRAASWRARCMHCQAALFSSIENACHRPAHPSAGKARQQEACSPSSRPYYGVYVLSIDGKYSQ